MRLFRRTGKDGKPTGPWLCWYYDEKGNRLQKSTKQFDKRAAELLARQWEREGINPPNEATLKDAFDLLISQRSELAKAGTRSDETVKMYSQKSSNWTAVLGEGFKLSEISPSVVDSYLTKRRTCESTQTPGKRRIPLASEHTLYKECITLKCALKLAQRAGIWSGSLESLFPSGLSSYYKPRKSSLKRQDLERLLEALQTRERGRVAFILATGARLSESSKAERGDVDGKFVRLRGTKTETAARVVVLTDSHQALLKIALDCGKDPVLFGTPTNFRRNVLLACKKLGIVPLTANDFRRSYATWGRAEGVSDSVLAAQLGHTTTTMLQRVYGRLDPDQIAELLAKSQAGVPCSNSAAAEG